MVASGTLTQMAAKGPQDLFLTCDAVITFWKGGYRRYTNFAIGEIEQCPQGQSGFGRTLCYKIERNGDLITHSYLQGTLDPVILCDPADPPGAIPAFVPAPLDGAYYTNAVGHAMIEEVTCNIGGHEFDKHTGEYLEIWETISAAPEKRMTEMTGFSESISGLEDFARRTQFLWVPMQFWWNRFYEQALPLIALQYHEVILKLKIRRLQDLGIERGGFIGCTSFSNSAVGAAPTFDDAILLISYVFLDTMERRMFAQQAHEYLFDQVQFVGGEGHLATSGSQSIRINFNHPTKELIWVAQRDAEGTDEDVIQKGTPFQGNDYFNWSGIEEDIPSFPGSPIILTFQTDPILNSQLFLNGHDRTLNFPSQYYRTVQPYEYHSRLIDKFVYLYSFALYPEDVKPSGSVNLSRIDNVVLRHTFPTSASFQWNGTVRTYGRSLNVLKIVSGMAGLMYAN